MPSDEYERRSDEEKEEMREEIRQHRSACRAIMQIQKENGMYAVHIGNEGGIQWEETHKVASERLRVDSVIREGQVKMRMALS